MNKEQVIQKAQNLKDRSGGFIFAFPLEEENPFSKYGVAVSLPDKWSVFPESVNLQEAAAGVLEIINTLKNEGFEVVYERDVRLVSYEAQINAPDVTMRRLRKTERAFYQQPVPVFEQGVDVMDNPDDEESRYISARGLLKFSYIEMTENKHPVGKNFMMEYYKLLAMRKYGKTAAAINQEVRRMDKAEAMQWIERTHKRFIKDDFEIIGIMNKVKAGSGRDLH